MRFIHRAIEKALLKASRNFPALILTGPRRAGKTTLLKKFFPKASYSLLEDPDIILRVKEDPRGFLEEIRTPAILDEIQNVPELLNYIQTRIDGAPSKMGQWLMTGSQEMPLMRGVSESMAGRAAVFQLFPLALEESSKVSLIHGGFPEILSRPRAFRDWFRSYVQTYLERDIRAMSSIRHLPTFRRFLSLLTSRSGQILNKADLAAPLGVSIPTLTEWLNILEMTAQIIVVPPFYENFGKRLIKSPKIYFMDSGLICHLLDIETESMLNRSPFLGSVFEGFVASEIVKHQVNRGKRRELYYFRDQQGLEVDFVVPSKSRKLNLLEVKASRTVFPAMAQSLERLARSISRYKTQKLIVTRPAGGLRDITSVVTSGVRAVSLEDLPHALE